MQEIAISCSCCGYMLTMKEDAAVCLCPACGTTNARPKSTGASLEMLDRAVKQRLARDFHEAEASYQQVLMHFPQEHEALWGRLLCRYGVEYIEDPSSGRRVPTVHSVQSKPMQEQADYQDACRFAPAEVALQYQRDAAFIDNAQAEIRRCAGECQPYDVFLCHKTTRGGSQQKTEDYNRAYEIYRFLTDNHVRVFFAPECMQEVVGANYEAAIYNALCTAKIMLVVCSNAEDLNSPWVRSEWMRYLDLRDAGEDKRLIPLMYDHFNLAEIPQFHLRNLQGIDMGQLTAAQAILTQVREVVPEPVVPFATLGDVAGGIAQGMTQLGKGAKVAMDKLQQMREEAARKKEERVASGQETFDGKRVCANCACPLDADEPVCPICGTPVGGVKPESEAGIPTVITFPEPREEWGEKIPQMQIMDADGNVTYGDVVWGESVIISCAKPMKLSIRHKVETNMRRINGAVGLLLLILAVIHLVTTIINMRFFMNTTGLDILATIYAYVVYELIDLAALATFGFVCVNNVNTEPATRLVVKPGEPCELCWNGRKLEACRKE